MLEKEHLFKKDILKKHLSKHSIGAYRRLYRAVEDSLKAILLVGSDSANEIVLEGSVTGVYVLFLS